MVTISKQIKYSISKRLKKYNVLLLALRKE